MRAQHETGAPVVIGLAGRGGVGKTTTAKAICEQIPATAITITAPIKHMLAAFYQSAGVSGPDIHRRLHGDLKRVPDPLLLGKTPTYAMQTLGGEWRDMIGGTLWSDIWVARTRPWLAKGVSVINDSVRYPHEVEVIHGLGGVVIGLTGRGDLAADHASERPVATDATVVVDSSPDEVALTVLVAVEDVISRGRRSPSR